MSVFALKGFALRGHLLPPASERPWCPVGVAVDTFGRVWVADSSGRLHRFTPNGAWERAWPLTPAPVHLAIDLRQRVYAISPGLHSTVRVLDGDGRPMPGAPPSVADARAAFPPLAFEVDAAGMMWLGSLCDDSASTQRRAFDGGGAPVQVMAGQAPAFVKAATYRSEALDSKIAECVWHRVVLSGALPAGATIRVRAFAAEERLTGSDLDALAVWQPCAVADVLDDDGNWDCLIRCTPGRYLWLELELEGNGVTAPSLDSIVVEFPRVSLRRYLPAVFGIEPSSADFTDRFLALFDTSLRSVERQVDQLARLFDPRSAPARTADPTQQDFLSWLGSWIGVTVDRNWDVATTRRFLERAGALFDRRGTPSGLREQLLLLLGFDQHAACVPLPATCKGCVPTPRNCGPEPASAVPDVPPLLLEHFRLRRWLRVGAGRLGDDAVVWGERIAGRTHLGSNAQANVTRLDRSPDPERDPFLVHANQFSVFVPARYREVERERKALENLIRAESPAGTRGNLVFVEPRFRIGVQATLGFDAVVGGVPRGITLGETPLGASVLAGPSHQQGGPSIAIGKEGRVGTTTVLT